MPLVDQFGRPLQTSPKPSRRPLAAAPIYDAWREYVTAGLTPQRLAAVLREADAGDLRRQAELFDQLAEKDAHLLGETSKRANVILDVDFTLTPASEDARDVKIADFIETFLTGLPDWDDTRVALQDAVGKGFAALELSWDVSSGQALPAGFDFIEQKRFTFLDARGLFAQVPRLITDSDPAGVEIPPFKMLFHRYGGKSGHPARAGIYRVCAWMYLFKNYAVKDWAVFCEVYGMPLRLGKYSPGASDDDKSALLSAIASLGSDAAGIISESTAIEFIESQSGKASGDLYQALADFANHEMSKALLGQTLSAEVGRTGSYAAAKTHNEVRLDLVKADARALAATIRDQLIRPIVGFNFGWDAPLPSYQAVWEESQDLTQKSKWVTALLDRHVEMPVSFIRREFNIPEPDGDEPVVGAPAAPAPPLPAKQDAGALTIAKDKKAAHSAAEAANDTDAADIIAGKLDTAAGPLVDGLVQPLRHLVMTAKNMADLQDGIIALYPDLDTADLAQVLAQALAAADLAGRFEVHNGS